MAAGVGECSAEHVRQSETDVIEHGLICIKGCPIRAQHVNITGDCVGHPPKLCFLRLYLLKRSLQSRSRFVLLGDVYWQIVPAHNAAFFHDLPGRLLS